MWYNKRMQRLGAIDTGGLLKWGIGLAIPMLIYTISAITNTNAEQNTKIYDHEGRIIRAETQLLEVAEINRKLDALLWERGINPKTIISK